MVKLLKRYLPSIVLAYLTCLGFLYFIQDSLIFPGSYILKVKEYVQRNDHLKKDIQSLSFTAKDGTKLDGAFIDNKSDSLVIYFGGNGENVKSTVSILSKTDSYDFISFNYRGFGKSGGAPSQKNIYSDALQIYERFKDSYENISLIGRSLGTAVAIYTAANKNIENLILVSPFDSITNIAQSRYIIFPVKLLIKHPFDSRENIKKINAPVSILMAENDKVVPNEHTLKLKKDVKNLKLFRIVEDSSHNKLFKNKELADFISEALK